MLGFFLPSSFVTYVTDRRPEIEIQMGKYACICTTSSQLQNTSFSLQEKAATHGYPLGQNVVVGQRAHLKGTQFS